MPSIATRIFRWSVMFLFVGLLPSDNAVGAGPEGLSRCAAIGDAMERLSCYDDLAGRRAPAVGTEPPAIAQTAETAAPVPSTAMAQHWELDQGEGIFNFRSHKPTYVLPVRYSEDPNVKPFRPLLDSEAVQLQDLDRFETKFQLSFKLKAIEGLFDERVDLWLGYTQQSHWQIFNESSSRPFRESDFEPELMLVVDTDMDLPGLRWRFVNLGLVHQSNGRSEPMSRSWNRIYAQFGFERGDFGLLVRPWYRIPENAKDDDNSDIDDYYGYGDVVAQYRIADHTLAAMLRGNLGEGKGGLQFDWTFPIAERIRGYLQAFTGYGESLVDYNHEQTTVGLGVSFFDWF